MKLGISVVALMAALLALSVLPSTAAAEDYDCADFRTQAEAEEYLLPGDPYNLDGDSDEKACEILPCPCSNTPGQGAEGEGQPAEPPPPPPYHLKLSTAKQMALGVAREFTRRDPNVTATGPVACRRRSELRINCFATARGETSTSRTTCRLQIVVRAVNRHPRATLKRSQCATRFKKPS